MHAPTHRIAILGYIDLSKRRVSPEDIKKCDEKYNKSKTVIITTNYAHFPFILLRPFIFVIGTQHYEARCRDAASQVGGSLQAVWLAPLQEVRSRLRRIQDCYSVRTRTVHFTMHYEQHYSNTNVC